MRFGRKKKAIQENKNKKEKNFAASKEKQRKKMIRTRYGQKQKKHARKGVQSCVLAASSALLLALVVGYSFLAKGDVGVWIGCFGILLLALAGLGLVFAVRGFKERDKNYITCRIGAVCSGLILTFLCGLFVRGLF